MAFLDPLHDPVHDTATRTTRRARVSIVGTLAARILHAPDATFTRALAAWRLRRERRLARLAFRRLLQYDARMLDDMGLTHEDVLWGASLPLELDAAHQVHHRAWRRRMRR